MSAGALVERVTAGDARAIARAISLVEDEDPQAAHLMRDLFKHTGRAYLIGVTGPPGAGKSTLVDKLVGEARGPDGTRKVGVLAVDPTSPFTGGAILGDRLRMRSHAQSDRVFIRSMATRGHMGGLARTTAEAALVLDAAGCEVIVIETVGVGQDEVDIVQAADVSIVTLVPGTGDEVQALKAGLMEIGDIFVVNKADLAGADRLAAAVESTLSLREDWPGGWRPPVLQTVATRGTGIRKVWESIDSFRALADDGDSDGRGSRRRVSRGGRQRIRAEHHLRELLGRRFVARLESDILARGELASLVARVAARDLDPYTAAEDLLARGLGPTAAKPPGPRISAVP